MIRHHPLVGGTNQGPEPKRALWVPAMVDRNSRQDRKDACKEQRVGASLPLGSNKDAYHFLCASALRNKDSTNMVNRDATEDYDHVSLNTILCWWSMVFKYIILYIYIRCWKKRI